MTNVSPVFGPMQKNLSIGSGCGNWKDEARQVSWAGPTGDVTEMLKAAGKTGTLWMTDVCNDVLRDGS